MGTFLHVYGDNIDEKHEVIYPGKCQSGSLGCFFTKDMSVIKSTGDAKSSTFSESSGAWSYSISTQKNKIPIGRQKWFLNSINKTVELVITPCNKVSKYTTIIESQ